MRILKGIALVAAAATVFGLSACGSSNSGSSDPYATASQTCFQEMTPDQKAQIQQYAAQNGDQANTVGNNADNTQDVCVLDSRGNEHYYRQQDHFGDYLMYSMLFGRSRTLLTYGVLSGDISPVEAMALSMLVGVDNSGRVFHPYTRTSSGWNRQPQVVNNVHVTNVYYGNSRKPTSFNTARQHPPAGYTNAPLPRSNGQSAKVQNSGGRPSVSTIPSRPSTNNGSTTKRTNPGSGTTHCLMGSGASFHSLPSGGGNGFTVVLTAGRGSGSGGGGFSARPASPRPPAPPRPQTPRPSGSGTHC